MMARKLAICFLIVMLTPCGFSGAETPVMSVSVRLKDRYNPDFRLCTSIRADAPLQIEWTNGTIKSRILGRLSAPEGDVYPLTFSMEVQTAEGPQFSETEGLKLRLGKPDEADFVTSSLFNDVHHRSVLLTNEGCE
jgi:hypothetical protein